MAGSGTEQARGFADGGDHAPGPILGPARDDRYYSTRLRQLGGLVVEEAEARALWREIVRHRRDVQQRLGRDVGQQVAMLDYVINVRRRLVQPQIIEKTALDAIAQLAIEDALTGLYNRRHFETELERETERCRRYGGSVSLLMLDLDHFKTINDRYGHPEGDRVLRKVGSLILHHVRAPDIACRCGGDEFAVILPDTPEADAVAVAERVRSAVEDAFLADTLGSPDLGEAASVSLTTEKVTASCGTATVSAELSSPGQLIAAADAALYRAKRAGGNRVLAAVPQDPGRMAGCSS